MKLKKQLGFIEVFSIACGAMISSGIFILPGIAHAKAGPAVIVSYLFAGILATTGMLSQAELVSAMPKAGGDYFYVTRTLGPAVGTVAGVLTWFSLSLKSSFALVGIAAFANLIFRINIHFVAILFCIIFIVINIIGIKEAGKTQLVLVAGLLGLMLFYVFRGLPAVNIHNFDPFAPEGFTAVISTAGFVFISFGGLLKISSIAEEVKNPGRTIPLAMIFSLLIVTMLYMLVIFVTSGVLGAEKLDNSLTPISDAAEVFLGVPGKILLSIAAILAFTSTANAGIMSAARYPLALSRDNLFPSFLSEVNGKYKTPFYSIVLTGILIVISLFLKLDILVKIASTVLILSYLFSCISIIILRESKIQNYQPVFHSPIYPWIQIIGIFGFGLFIFKMGKQALFASFIFFLLGFLIFLLYGRKRTKMQYALLHIIERAIDKTFLKDRSLESELKEIIKERDEIKIDRFDKIIEKSPILDIGKKMEMYEFFKITAKEISKEIHIEPDKILKQLLRRERESSTAIRKDLAIPHIIIDGEKIFRILIARCRKGIYFSPFAQDVKAVFVIIGTRDERNFHLRALSSIAQIVQDPQFEKKWEEAKDKEALRDIILLGKRRR